MDAKAKVDNEKKVMVNNFASHKNTIDKELREKNALYLDSESALRNAEREIGRLQ